MEPGAFSQAPRSTVVRMRTVCSWLAALWLAGLASVALAQTPAASASGADGARVGSSRRAAVLPPPQPVPENPVNKFSELLRLDVAGREKVLQGKTEWQQRYLRDRLAEFDALGSTEREVRLGLMHLRYYMLMAMRAPAAQRDQRLTGVPPEYRDLIAERLLAWEKLPADQQKELLQNEAVLSQISWFEIGGVTRPEAEVPASSARGSPELQSDLQRWRELPEVQRERMTRNFSQFFQLSSRQRQKILQRVDEADRTVVERATAALERLPSAERLQCIDALNRYADMTAEERARFLQNAARWRAMSSEERQAWRWVASHVAPGKAFPARPPMPPPPIPRVTSADRRLPEATNSQVAR